MMKAYLVPTLFREIDGRTPMLHPAAVDKYVYIPSVPLTYLRDYASNLLLITQVTGIRVACPSQRADFLFDRSAGGWIALEEDDVCAGGCTVAKACQRRLARVIPFEASGVGYRIELGCITYSATVNPAPIPRVPPVMRTVLPCKPKSETKYCALFCAAMPMRSKTNNASASIL